jgi:hypothetical protein
MDGASYPGNYKVKGIDPLFTAITGAEGFVFCFGKQPNDVVALGLHPMIEGPNGTACNNVL